MDRLREQVLEAARDLKAVPSCEHLKRDMDFFSPILQERELLCRNCAADATFVLKCDHCGSGLDGTITVCTVTFERFGSSHIQDHFIALLCETCGTNVPVGKRPIDIAFVEMDDGRRTMCIFRPSATRVECGTMPVMIHTERQEKDLAAAAQEAASGS